MHACRPYPRVLLSTLYSYLHSDPPSHKLPLEGRSLAQAPRQSNTTSTLCPNHCPRHHRPVLCHLLSCTANSCRTPTPKCCWSTCQHMQCMCQHFILLIYTTSFCTSQSAQVSSRPRKRNCSTPNAAFIHPATADLAAASVTGHQGGTLTATHQACSIPNQRCGWRRSRAFAPLLGSNRDLATPRRPPLMYSSGLCACCFTGHRCSHACGCCMPVLMPSGRQPSTRGRKLAGQLPAVLGLEDWTDRSRLAT
jgi:hypothetical protein